MSKIKCFYVDQIVDMYLDSKMSIDDIAKKLDIPVEDVEAITNELED